MKPLKSVLAKIVSCSSIWIMLLAIKYILSIPFEKIICFLNHRLFQCSLLGFCVCSSSSQDTFYSLFGGFAFFEMRGYHLIVAQAGLPLPTVGVTAGCHHT